MPFHEKNGVLYYQFENLSRSGVVHAIFTRHGGVSPKPWKSLNVGGLVGDDPINVARNKEIALSTFGCAPKSVYEVWQVHSKKIVTSDVPKDISIPYQKADGILTGTTGVTLFMRFADCVPILFYDPCNRVVGLVHAGWQGTVKMISACAVKNMEEQFGSNPKDLIVGIGPSIGPGKYEIGLDVEQQVVSAFKNNTKKFIRSHNGSLWFDLWGANVHILESQGVSNIEVAGICTASNIDDWYSYREENGLTGRFGALIKLE